MKLTKLLLGGITCGISLMMFSCGNKLPIDSLSELPAFAELNFPKEKSDLRADSIDLFIDYSTCVAEAMNSPFYQAVHPTIVDCSPIFWSIKGNDITKETNDKQTVYALLRTIKEVNNAELKKAVEQIVDNNHQAVLITDAEYYMKGVTGDNLNNPYLADSFRKWMTRGNDIYIYSEPYLEDGKYNKLRYYMIFTDNRLSNNIQERFQRSCPASSNVTMFHLSNKPIRPTIDEKYPVIDENLSWNESTYLNPEKNGIECQEYQTSWEDIYKYLVKNATDNQGNPLEKGLPVLRGIFVTKQNSESFKTTKLKVNVYQICGEYLTYCDSVASNGNLAPAKEFKEVKQVFVADQDAFEKNGEIILRLDPNMDGSTLSSEMPNLLKVDFVIEEAQENFTSNEEANKNFVWTSISAANNGNLNTSLFESIKQALIDPAINPAHQKNKTVYSLYLSTCSN